MLQVNMSDRIFTLLLTLSLTLPNVCSGFNVRTYLQYNFKNFVNIICEHDVDPNNKWTMGATLLTNGKNVCDNNNNTTCNKTSLKKNQFIFTLNNSTENRQFLYRCQVFRLSPLPIQKREGEDISLLTGCAHPLPSNCSLDVEKNCPLAGLPRLLLWALLGIVLLLSFYSLIITVVYISLRRQFSELLTVTYVSMQQNQVRPKKKQKGHGADKNAEYMDMREVHQHAQPIKDVNHNSCLNPGGFTA